MNEKKLKLGRLPLLHYINSAIVIIALVLIAILAIQNLEAIEVSFLAWSITVSKILVILGTYFLGMLTGGSLLHFAKYYFKSSQPA